MMNRSLSASLLCLLSCLPACRDSERSGLAELPTFEVGAPATFVRLITADGTLQAAQATPLVAPPDSERPMKIAWVARDGRRVEQDEVVVRFDASEMERTLADNRDDVRAAKTQIAKEEVLGTVTSKKRDAAASLADFEAEVATQFKGTDTRIFSRHDIIESAIDLEFAEAKSEHARDVKQIEGSLSAHKLELHEIDRGHSKKEVTRAEEALAKLQVRAPHPGILVLARNWRGEPVRVGDTVWRGQKLAELPLVAKMQARVFVLEADAGSLDEGLDAKLVIDAHPDVTYEATVEQVDTLAQPKHPEVPVHYFGVTLALEETDLDRMRVGQRVRATIRVERPDALVIPRQAVFEKDGETIVYRRDAQGSEFEPVEVDLGSSSAGRVVIERGLEPGDHVAMRNPTISNEASSAPDEAEDLKEGS